MSGGYELTEVRPGVDDYKAVPSAVRPVLEYIFTDGFPHSIHDVGYDYHKATSLCTWKKRIRQNGPLNKFVIFIYAL